MDVPALATTGSDQDPLPGALGQPNTEVLFGDSSLNDEARSGVRFALGKWVDSCQFYGMEATYLALSEEDSGFSASDDDFAVLGRPFFNTVTSAEDARVVASPGVLAGTLDVRATTDFQTLELLLRRALWRANCKRIDFLVGYRFADLDDHVRIDESSVSLAGPTTGATIDLFDQFDTRSSFHGAEFGLVMQRRVRPCWSGEFVAKIAIGESNYRTRVSGQTITEDNLGGVATTGVGLLAQGTNIGTVRWDDLAMMSELGISLRRQLRCGLTASVGYSLLYWSDVARAGDQIDTTVNPTQIPPGTLMGEPRPAVPFRTTDFWAQGLRLGLEYNF